MGAKRKSTERDTNALGQCLFAWILGGGAKHLRSHPVNGWSEVGPLRRLSDMGNTEVDPMLVVDETPLALIGSARARDSGGVERLHGPGIPDNDV